MNKKKYSFETFIIAISLLIACGAPNQKETTLVKTKPPVDSLNDAIFECYLNGNHWDKNDSVSAIFKRKSNICFLYLNSRYNSAIYENITLMSPIGEISGNRNKAIQKLENDTLIAMITYSFAEIDYSSDPPMPVNHLAFNVRPCALISISNVDTLKSTISGTFKGFAEDERKVKHTFQKGIFRNVPYINLY